MTREEKEKAISTLHWLHNNTFLFRTTEEDVKFATEFAIKVLEQEPCEMTAEEYRQRLIQTFHNADTDELIAVCVLPTEKEFENLEWLLKNHYKKLVEQKESEEV